MSSKAGGGVDEHDGAEPSDKTNKASYEYTDEMIWTNVDEYNSKIYSGLKLIFQCG